MSTSVMVKEDEKNLYFTYHFSGYEWVLIYNKYKDKVLVLKESKPAQLPKLTADETEMYREVLDYAIAYHHEKGDAETH